MQRSLAEPTCIYLVGANKVKVFFFDRRSCNFAVLFALVATGTARGDPERTITLGTGTQKVLPLSGIQRAAVGDPTVADVKAISADQLLITAHREGKTTLLIWKISGQRFSYAVVVRKQDPHEVVKEIKKLLGDIEGISVRAVGDHIYVEGQAYTSPDADRIDQIVNLYPSIKSFVTVAPHAKRSVAHNLNTHFQKAGLKNIQANVIGSTVFLEGSVESQQDLQKAELITKAIGEKVENLLVVGVKRMILSEVQFVEIRRSSKDRYGVKYPTDVAGTVSATTTASKELFPGHLAEGALRANGSLNSSFSAGFQQNDGHGRLLAQPRLVCASGEKAEFISGGEIPIPLITNNTFTVEYKPYGVILEIRPTADRYGNIQTEIKAEASEVDLSVAVAAGGNSAIPGFLTRKVKTNVTVRNGETIVLSGVFSFDEAKAVSKLPGLGHIPIIGELFKNRAFDSTRRELVIFVTPQIVNPDSENLQNSVNDAQRHYQSAKGDVRFNVFD